MKFQLKGAEYIELIKLLKLLRIASSGGQAKIMVENREVKLNGQVELRKRAKLHTGDIIETEGKRITIEP